MPTRQTSDPLTYDLRGQAAVKKTLITTAQAADLLGVHPETVRRLIADGRLRYFKIRRSVRIDAADLDAYIEACAVEPWRTRS